MFFVCRSCGAWSTERPVVKAAVVCRCGHCRPVNLRELFVLTGASGTGKSTIGDELLGQIEDPVVLETDILWAPEMNTPQDGYARFRSTWMRLAVNIAQSGRSTLLIGAGVPEQFQARPERRYIGDIHWLALVCSDEVLEQRLRSRPAWRAVTDEFVGEMLEFNHHLGGRTDVARIDTGDQSVEATREEVFAWLRQRARLAPAAP